MSIIIKHKLLTSGSLGFLTGTKMVLGAVIHSSNSFGV